MAASATNLYLTNTFPSCAVFLPSDILRRLNSSSRKNKLYFGFRELGRVVRTIFLLRYLSDGELRRTIQAATNKSERFNQFVQWVSFGGDSVIAENTRDEQRKFVKYNHLVANLLVFHNIVTLSRALERLHADGLKASAQAMATLTPYQTEHINRFGNYTVNFSRTPEPLPLNLLESEAPWSITSAGKVCVRISSESFSPVYSGTISQSHHLWPRDPLRLLQFGQLLRQLDQKRAGPRNHINAQNVN